MPKVVTLRPVNENEKRELERLSRSRTAAQRQVERAQIILGWLAGQRPAVTAEHIGCSLNTVYHQLHQFNARGLAFLDDAPRSGRPLHYDEQQRGQLVVTAKTKLETLVPGAWALDAGSPRRVRQHGAEHSHFPEPTGGGADARRLEVVSREDLFQRQS
jgi:hypothetical protein